MSHDQQGAAAPMEADDLPGMDVDLLQGMATSADQAPQAGTVALPGKDAAQVVAEYSGLLQTILAPAFAILAPAWRVEGKEVAALSDAWGGVLAEYFPGGIEDTPWLIAAVTTAGIFGPRIAAGMPRRIVEEKPAAAAQPQGVVKTTADGGAPPPSPVKTTEGA